MPKPIKRRSNILGFSLLEVLITVLLITVGVLGMVAMQGRSIQYTNDSMNRTQAAILANELIEIIRASPTSTVTGDAFYVTEADDLPTSSGDCRAIGATALMDDQVACWADKVRVLLPDSGSAAISSQFYICRSALPGSCGDGAAVEIQLAWRAAGGQCLNNDAVDSDICTYRVRTQI